MNIYSTDSTFQVRERFRDRYPMLDLHFYRSAHKPFRGNLETEELRADLPLTTLSPNIKDGTVNIDGEVTAISLEQALEEDFGLHVQLVRRSGRQWMQTSLTDKWTLQHHMNFAAAEAEAETDG